MRFFLFLVSSLLMLSCLPVSSLWARVDTLRAFPEKRFVNGAADFEKYLAKNLRYPPQAQQEAIVGTSLVSIIVTPTGKLANVAIVNSLGKAIDGEVKRVFQATAKLWLPTDQPGSQDSIMLVMPVLFSLSDKSFYVETVKPDFILPEIIVVGYSPQVSTKNDEYYLTELASALQKKNYKQMLKLVNELIRRNPYSDKLYLQRATIERELGQQEEACSDYKKIINFLGKTRLPKQFVQNCP